MRITCHPGHHIFYKKAAGFTLVEIIIALFIFAIVGTMAAIGLRNVVDTHQKVETKTKSLQQLEIAMSIMQRDILQAMPRSIADQDGHLQAPFIADGSSSLEFTAGGYYNPMSYARRSELHRVSYQLDGKKLVRLTWMALDRPPNIKPDKRVLLTDVSSMKISFIDATGRPQAAWPPVTNTNKDPMFKKLNILPKSVIVKLKLKDWGEVDRIITLPGAMYRAKT